MSNVGGVVERGKVLHRGGLGGLLIGQKELSGKRTMIMIIICSEQMINIKDFKVNHQTLHSKLIRLHKRFIILYSSCLLY